MPSTSITFYCCHELKSSRTRHQSRSLFLASIWSQESGSNLGGCQDLHSFGFDLIEVMKKQQTHMQKSWDPVDGALRWTFRWHYIHQEGRGRLANLSSQSLGEQSQAAGIPTWERKPRSVLEAVVCTLHTLSTSVLKAREGLAVPMGLRHTFTKDFISPHRWRKWFTTQTSNANEDCGLH